MKRHKVALALMVLVLITGLGAKMYSNVTMGDGEWVGLGANAGRIVFDDQATDEITFRDAEVIVDTDSGSDPFWVTRLGDENQGGKIYADDAKLVIHSIQDEPTGYHGSMTFRLGSQANQAPNFVISDYRSGSDVPVVHIDIDTAQVGINTTGPVYDLDVNGDIRATENMLANGSVLAGSDGDEIAYSQAMPFAAAEEDQGGFLFFQEDVTEGHGLTSIYDPETAVCRGAWVQWLVTDLTANTHHTGSGFLEYTGGNNEMVIADEGADDLLFQVVRGAPPNLCGAMMLEREGTHTYAVSLLVMWQ